MLNTLSDHFSLITWFSFKTSHLFCSMDLSLICSLELETINVLNICCFMFCFVVLFLPWLFGRRERTMDAMKGFDIDAPRWDQSTFMGRLKHFFNITDWRTVLLPDSRLDEAKVLVESCRWRNRLIWWGYLYAFLPVSYFLSLPLSLRAGSIPPGTTEEQLHYAKKLYDSAFHPDTGDRMNLTGRMSFQVPGGMAITGFMLQFYRSAFKMF